MCVCLTLNAEGEGLYDHFSFSNVCVYVNISIHLSFSWHSFKKKINKQYFVYINQFINRKK